MCVALRRPTWLIDARGGRRDSIIRTHAALRLSPSSIGCLAKLGRGLLTALVPAAHDLAGRFTAAEPERQSDGHRNCADCRHEQRVDEGRGTTNLVHCD